MFEFLPANMDNCGSLFCINAKRKIVNRETTFMAKKQTGCKNNVINQDKRKKVMFNEDITTYTYEEENDKEKKTNKKSKKEKNYEYK